MPPIVFSDIGKAASDLLGKDFPVGSIKLETKTTASNGVNFTVSGAKDNKTGGIAGELKTKYADKARGLTLTETWTTSNVLSAEVELADSLTKGLKLNLLGSLLPHAGTKNAKVSLEYKQDALATRSSIDLFKGPIATADLALNHDGILFGAETAYDLASGNVTKYNFAFGYATREYAMALHAANKLDTFAGSYFHKVNKELEAGGRATWDRKSGANVSLELAAKYALDKDAFVKAKIDNAGKLGLGYTQVLRPGVKASLGGVFDTTRLGENVHKVGMSIVLDA
ncbi:eukaryotic porin/Tom40 [Catenaria anguillulae PL171]|uniref:Eukaryotic porin/Tom40 n=1 Tax=Catenaria anguillulae PL171 TaxID=765915 RepID=A0A1Y2HP45_9FUNG|nr:eukaryotic porin/Tom40 [Catenaria anguillulae PL171]